MSVKSNKIPYLTVKTKKSLHNNLTPNQKKLREYNHNNPNFQREFSKFLKSIDRMIYSQAKQYANGNKELCEDLYQEGVIGAMTGFLKYRSDMKTKPSSYCFFWIRQQMQTYLNQKASTITVSHYARNKIKKYKKNWDSLSEKEKNLISEYEAKFHTLSLDGESLDFKV